MAPIYSTQLANVLYSASGTHTIYTVPAGALVVVTDVTLFNDFTASNQIGYVSLGPGYALFNLSSGAGTLLTHWSGKQVLNAGQTITVGVPGLGGTVMATGYLLNS